MPDACFLQRNGIEVRGTDNVFDGDLTILGPCLGNSYTINRIVCNADLIVTSGNLASGYGGQLNVLLGGNLELNGGNVAVYNLTVNGLTVHDFSQTSTESSLAATIDATVGESIRITTNLLVASGTIFRLYGGTLDLNLHNLDSATLLNGIVQGGALSYCTALSTTLNNVTISNALYLNDNNSVATGLLTNAGLIAGKSYTEAVFTVLGEIVNSGNLSAGYAGTLTIVCHGSINNVGNWPVSTKIRGTLPRTLNLNTPGYQISIDNGSSPTLSGSNLLSSFTVETGSLLSIAAGGELQMAAVDNFYLANTPGYGSFVNNGIFKNTQSVINLTWLPFYGLQIYAAGNLASTYGSIQTTHSYGVSVPELSGVIPETWSVLPISYSAIETGMMKFTHSAQLLQRGFEGCLELYYKPLGQSNWIAYSGEISFGTDGNTFTALDIPMGGDYAFVANNLSAPTGLQLILADTAFGVRPKLQWNSVTNATYYHILRSGTPDGDWALATRTTETFWVETQDLPCQFYKVVAHQGTMP